MKPKSDVSDTIAMSNNLQDSDIKILDELDDLTLSRNERLKAIHFIINEIVPPGYMDLSNVMSAVSLFCNLSYEGVGDSLS